MDAELEAHRAHAHAVASALQTVADGMPALGIVAAVLGVIHTMGQSLSRRRYSDTSSAARWSGPLPACW